MNAYERLWKTKLFEVQANAGAYHYTAELYGSGWIRIYRNGEWAGSGRWSGSRIEDCSAVLSPEEGEDDNVYEILDELIAAAITE